MHFTILRVYHHFYFGSFNYVTMIPNCLKWRFLPLQLSSVTWNLQYFNAIYGNYLNWFGTSLFFSLLAQITFFLLLVIPLSGNFLHLGNLIENCFFFVKPITHVWDIVLFVLIMSRIFTVTRTTMSALTQLPTPEFVRLSPTSLADK